MGAQSLHFTCCVCDSIHSLWFNFIKPRRTYYWGVTTPNKFNVDSGYSASDQGPGRMWPTRRRGPTASQVRGRCSFSAAGLVGIDIALWCDSLVVIKKARPERSRESRLPAGPRFALSARVEMNRIKATRPPICYRNHHLLPPDIDILDMDDILQSFSKLKKGFKHRFRGKKSGADTAGANAAGETTRSSPSLTQPDSRATASGRDQEGGRINTDVSHAHSRDRSPHPKPRQADEGGDDPQGREANVDEKGASQSQLRLAPDVGGAAGSRPSREIIHAPSPLSVAPISPEQGPDSTWTFLLGSSV